MRAKDGYNRLMTLRDPYLQRAREASRYTIPLLVPPAGATGATLLKTTYSSLGARLVNSLASKLLLSLFPPNAPFFKLLIVDPRVEQAQQADPKLKAETDKALQKAEKAVVDEIETTATRTPAMAGLRHLIVAGNVLAYLSPQGTLRMFPLTQYVCKRAPDGDPIEIYVEERISPAEIDDDEFGKAVKAKAKAKAGGKVQNSGEDTLCLYTGIVYENGSWKVWQEIEDDKIPGSDGTYPEDACPWLPLRWTIVDGEDYGRGMVEEYLGDLISFEGLTRAIVKGTAVSAKAVFLRNPNGTTKAKTVTRAETGDVVDGKIEDINVLQVNKHADFQIARQLLADLKEQLSYAFLVNTAIQRQAERVTAEEIRFMASELDSTLGGIYSLLSLEFQLPYLRRLMLQMQRDKKLPLLPKGSVKPVIVTGVQALGRGADLEKLKAYVSDVVALGGPEALQKWLNFDILLSRLAVARQMEVDGLVKTQDEVTAATQQEQMQALVQQLGPNAVNQLGGLANTALKGNQKQ